MITYLQIVKLAHKEPQWSTNKDMQLGYGRENVQVAIFKGVSHFEAKF